MNNLSPARSSLSTTATAGGGGGGNGGSNSSSVAFPAIDEIRFPEDVDSAQDQKEEALAVLKSEVKAELDKVVKSMDEDSWMFEVPRSRIHLVSRPDLKILVGLLSILRDLVPMHIVGSFIIGTDKDIHPRYLPTETNKILHQVTKSDALKIIPSLVK